MSASTTRERLAGFAARCRASGLAVTPQRLAIFRHLASTDRHPSAEELHATVRRELPTLSLATVYKALDTLASVGAGRAVSRLGETGPINGGEDEHDGALVVSSPNIYGLVDHARLQRGEHDASYRNPAHVGT